MPTQSSTDFVSDFTTHFTADNPAVQAAHNKANDTIDYPAHSAAILSAYHCAQLPTQSSTQLAVYFTTHHAADNPAVQSAHI